jgi:hypothetical protein
MRYLDDALSLGVKMMDNSTHSDVQEVIEWWKEYGFKRNDCERADVDPLFKELLEKMNELSEEAEMAVFQWIEDNW